MAFAFEGQHTANQISKEIKHSRVLAWATAGEVVGGTAADAGDGDSS